LIQFFLFALIGFHLCDAFSLVLLSKKQLLEKWEETNWWIAKSNMEWSSGRMGEWKTSIFSSSSSSGCWIWIKDTWFFVSISFRFLLVNLDSVLQEISFWIAALLCEIEFWTSEVFVCWEGLFLHHKTKPNKSQKNSNHSIKLSLNIALNI
jgi:hypothetical protein